MRRLYKLGGSLLDHACLINILSEFFTAEAKLASQNKYKFEPILILGGGRTADIVRDWDQQHSLGDEQAHWLALKALDFNAELLTLIFVNAFPVVSEVEISQAWERALIPMLKPYAFVKRFEATSHLPLPHHWDVTTDSVALWLGHHLQIEEYVFLKSCNCQVDYLQAGTTFINTQYLAEISQQKLIDPYFPILYQQLPEPPKIKWVNLRK
jgi:aspartokinase-like uncharacterized kinase